MPSSAISRCPRTTTPRPEIMHMPEESCRMCSIHNRHLPLGYANRTCPTAKERFLVPTRGEGNTPKPKDGLLISKDLKVVISAYSDISMVDFLTQAFKRSRSLAAPSSRPRIVWLVCHDDSDIRAHRVRDHRAEAGVASLPRLRSPAWSLESRKEGPGVLSMDLGSSGEYMYPYSLSSRRD